MVPTKGHRTIALRCGAVQSRSAHKVCFWPEAVVHRSDLLVSGSKTIVEGSRGAVYLHALISLSMAAVLPLSDTVRDGSSIPLSVTPTSLLVFNSEMIGLPNST